jgi:hypothetical protein
VLNPLRHQARFLRLQAPVIGMAQGDFASGHDALPFTGGSATELSATDACATGGRAGDDLDMGCPIQLVQCQKTYRQCPLWVQKQTFAVQNGMSALYPHKRTFLCSCVRSKLLTGGQ